MREDLAQIKQQMPLLDYLRGLGWSARQAGSQPEFVGLCPLHQETQPSFYVNTAKNLFYCHGCGRGGDLFRFVQFYFSLSFAQSVAHLHQELGTAASSEGELLEPTAAFYQFELHRHQEACEYLARRGLHDPDIIQRLGVGFAPGGSLRRHLTARGYPLAALRRAGLVTQEGRDTLFRRLVFPCRRQARIVNLYGRSIDNSAPHRFLPGGKGDLVNWDAARALPNVILVEGMFDLASLWQAGFHNATCARGTHLTPAQFAQLCDRPGREVFIAFDQDRNSAGQRAAHTLAQRLVLSGIPARIVTLPPGHDPNSLFAAGAAAADFAHYLAQARLP
jgi:DNA primase